MCAFIGISPSPDEIAICVLDQEGHVLSEGLVGGGPGAVIAYLNSQNAKSARVGLKANVFAPYLCEALVGAGFRAVCIEERTDRGADARAIAETLRLNRSEIVQLSTSGNGVPVFRRCVPISRDKAYAVLEDFEIEKLGSFSDDEWAQLIERMQSVLTDAGLFHAI